MMRIATIAAAALFNLSCGGESRPVLHLYTSLDAQEAPTYIEAFEAETGVDVEWVRLSAGEALARLEAEKARPEVSVWFGGPSPEYIVAAQRGLLEPFEPAIDYPLAPPFRGDNWEWNGLYFGVIGFACNKQILAAQNASCPDSWSALTGPALKGQLSIAYPNTSGTAYVVVAALLAHMGEERGWEYIRALDANVHHYNSSGSAAVTQAGLGEVGVGIAFAHDILKKGIERGYPLELRIPKDGTPSEIGAVAIVRGAPQPELARQFVNWLLSLPAQNLLQQYYRVPLHPDAGIANGTVRRDDVNVMEFSARDAARDQARILAQWRQITGR